MKNICIFLLVAFVFTSCSKKGITKTEGKSTKNYTLKRALEAYEANTLDFDTFSAKVKCRYKDKKQSLTVKTTIRIKKDEKIWVSAGMFGFEGVRALITPDSVFVINRLEKKYYEESIEELQTISGLPVDFSMLQNLITGKLLLVNEKNATITQKEGVYELMSELKKITSLALLDDASFQLEQQTMIEQSENRQMDITYHDYQTIGRARFPYESKVHVNGEDELWLDLEFSNIEINEDISLPFSINKNYKKGEL